VGLKFVGLLWLLINVIGILSYTSDVEEMFLYQKYVNLKSMRSFVLELSHALSDSYQTVMTTWFETLSSPCEMFNMHAFLPFLAKCFIKLGYLSVIVI